MSADDIARIPTGNLRVPRDEFAALWRTAERHQREHESDWYGAGVVVTCRWLAQATVRPKRGPPRPARSPVGGDTVLSYQEAIEAELLAAEKLAVRRPAWLDEQPGWIEGVVATLRWAWSGWDVPPMRPVGD